MKKTILLAILMFCLPATASAQMDNIQGQWLITAMLIAKSEPDPLIKEGYTKQEQWTITQQGSQASITTPSGTIQGQYVAPDATYPSGSWQFMADVYNLMGQPNLAARFEVVIGGATATLLQGGSRVTFYGGNPYSSQWTPMGLESWRFEAERIN